MEINLISTASALLNVRYMQARFFSKKQRQRDKEAAEQAARLAKPVVTVTLAVVDGYERGYEQGARVRMTVFPVAKSSSADVTLKKMTTPWADGFALVTEEGWAALGEGAYAVRRFHDRQEAIAESGKLWCCWVLYKEDVASYEEVASGGVGFANYAIRNFVQDKMSEMKREARRASLGEAAAAAPAEDPANDLKPEYDAYM